MQEIGRLFNPFPTNFTSDKTDGVTEKCVFCIIKQQFLLLLLFLLLSFLFTPGPLKKKEEEENLSYNLFPANFHKKVTIEHWTSSQTSATLSSPSSKGSTLKLGSVQSQRNGRDVSLYFSPPHVFLLTYYQILSTVKC